jgi:hypothetical protein
MPAFNTGARHGTLSQSNDRHPHPVAAGDTIRHARRSGELRRRMERSDCLVELGLRQWRDRLDRYQQWRVASTDAMMKASGNVAEAGSISVTLASGIKRAIGFGHLAGTSGSGTWHGPLCSGTWTAQRI